ncbi:MAG: hypothetical protein LWX56_03465 [Ignavibacteria bacterium]|nr:hypothetical protein [Ignavibacteria bacterium]
MKKILIGGKVITESGTIEVAYAIIQNNVICSFGDLEGFVPPDDAELIDCSGSKLLITGSSYVIEENTN